MHRPWLPHAGRDGEPLDLKDRHPTAPSLIGIEHEFRVLDPHGSVDINGVIHELRLGRGNLDPSDPNAHRMGTGASITCDEAEAELALPPEIVRPGFVRRAEQGAASERRRLARRLGRHDPPLRIEGFSTHISASIAGSHPDPVVAELFTRHFSVGLMLLIERPTSFGVMVRPRPGRLEVGGEYVTGAALEAALAYVAGAVAVCQAASSTRDHGDLPPAVTMELQPARQRFGSVVGRHSLGPDLYREGRYARLHATDGRSIRAGDLLAMSWCSARTALDGVVDASVDLEAGDAMVAGRIPLPLEAADPVGAAPRDPGRAPRRSRGPFGAALAIRHRPGYDVAPVMLTWQMAIYVIADVSRARLGYVFVPGTDLPAFLAALRIGEIDGQIRRFLASPPRGRILMTRNRPAGPALFDLLGLRMGLLDPERDLDGSLPTRLDRRSQRGRWALPSWPRRQRAC